MSSFRSFSEIVATMIQRLRLTQPNLDTKPGTVSRDLFIDIPADQISRLYSAVNLVSQKQSLATTSGRDLEKLAANFGTARSTGSAANGIVVFCTNTVTADIPIPTGTLVTARNGAVYKTVGNFVMSSVDRNRLAANANRMRKSLSIAGISASYALEVPVQALRNGTSGNVSSLQVVSTNLGASASVTNLTSMTGGANSETDDSFRSRILSIFSGANIGTAFGYRNALMGVDGVVDALVVEPGNSLMLRDGTETIELEDGSSRILSSGTGGKVDAYILGRKIQTVSDSYIFSDLSGSGNITDDRNDYILGQSTQDLTKTSEERRAAAFKDSNIPAQPVDSIASVTGSSSGLLIEQYIDDNGVVRGNYVLEKDYNPETGGSPFGFDRISFISNTKNITGESILKKEEFGPESLAFSGVDRISEVYSDINEINENSEVSVAGSQYIRLLHTPVVKVNKVVNRTSGEVYSIASQDLNEEGLNETGIVEIKGRSLPSSADILAVNYMWRHVYSPYIDYAGGLSVEQFSDNLKTDSIDWSPSGGIFEEESVITKSADGLMYEIVLGNNINKVVSAYRRDSASANVSVIETVGNTPMIGLEISLDYDAIDNIISVKRVSDGLEVFNTAYADGSHEARVIYLPSDSPVTIGDEVIVDYNKVELFDIGKTDGSSYNNTVILPSEGVMSDSDILDMVELMYFSSEPIYVRYVANSSSVYSETALSNLPIVGSDSTNTLAASDNFTSTLSNQPIFYSFGSAGDKSGIERFGAAPLLVSASGVVNPGKIRILGETLLSVSLDVDAGSSYDNGVFDLQSEIKDALGLTALSSEIGIAKVNRALKLTSGGSSEEEFDTFGSALKDVRFSIGSAEKDDSLMNYELRLPKTILNNSIQISSGDKIRLEVVVYNLSGYEEIYFDSSSDKITSSRYGRIKRISVSSGFRTAGGNLSGNISVDTFSQPRPGTSYYADYEFTSPKEGERLTISYNVNRLVIDATAGLERVRPITADVLVKEAEELLIDIQGSILINSDALSEADRIADSVINAVTNLLSTARLGPTVDFSDVISVAAAQNGVDSVNISIFNESGKTGRKPFIKALDNQTISPGNITFEAVSRSKFRIN